MFLCPYHYKPLRLFNNIFDNMSVNTLLGLSDAITLCLDSFFKLQIVRIKSIVRGCSFGIGEIL